MSTNSSSSNRTDDDITLLTFDVKAGMAYLYLADPAVSVVHRTRHTSFGGDDCSMFPAAVDCDASGRSLGVEFPAATRSEALARAAEVEGNVA